jgi:hypothetical protein
VTVYKPRQASLGIGQEQVTWIASPGSSTSLCEPQTDLTPQGESDEKVTVVRTRLEEQLVTIANSPTMLPGLDVEGLTPMLIFKQPEPPRSGAGADFDDCAANGMAINIRHAHMSIPLTNRIDINRFLLPPAHEQQGKDLSSLSRSPCGIPIGSTQPGSRRLDCMMRMPRSTYKLIINEGGLSPDTTNEGEVILIRLPTLMLRSFYHILPCALWHALNGGKTIIYAVRFFAQEF